MPKLPSITGLEIVRIFKKFGWQVDRQAGSHIIMTKEGSLVTLSIPNHDPVKKGTLRALIRVAGLTVDEFIKA